MKFTKEDRKWIYFIMLIIAFGILFFAVVNNFSFFLGALFYLFQVIQPFFVAMILSFIVNMPMQIIEFFLERLSMPSRPRRIIAMVLSYALILFIFIFVFAICVPRLYDSIRSFIRFTPELLRGLRSTVTGADWLGPAQKNIVQAIDKINTTPLYNYLMDWYRNNQSTIQFNTVVGNLFSTLSSVFSGVVSTVASVMFSIYMLSQKEQLSRQVKSLIFAVFPEKFADAVMYLGYTIYDNFYNFFSGQMLEAFLLGTMNYVGMRILGMESALVISLLTMLGAFIPVVGAMLSGILGALMLLVQSPVAAFGYFIYITALQQLENNIVYPRVVGQSIGLPGIWVLLAIIIGGSLFGVYGIFLSVPIFSTLYVLLGDFIDRRIAEKNLRIQLK